MGPIGLPVAGVEKDNKKNRENKAVVVAVVENGCGEMHGSFI